MGHPHKNDRDFAGHFYFTKHQVNKAAGSRVFPVGTIAVSETGSFGMG